MALGIWAPPEKGPPRGPWEPLASRFQGPRGLQAGPRGTWPKPWPPDALFGRTRVTRVTFVTRLRVTRVTRVTADPWSFWRFCVSAPREILCTVLIPGALADFFCFDFRRLLVAAPVRPLNLRIRNARFFRNH